ncbi:MAG: helix-turn-helix transcriptional regulator [Lachnospiraceae bacterium]|nr:helix-turn-helix transcriptional regulator [Lachnospiraceae bacterium]
MEFGERLYRLRIEQGVYQKQLAIYLNVSVGTISNYENGVHSPDLKSLRKIADYFKVSVDYLLGRTEYVSPIEDLNRELIDQYTSGDIMNTVLELSKDSCRDLVKYLEMLKLYEEKDEKAAGKKKKSR